MHCRILWRPTNDKVRRSTYDPNSIFELVPHLHAFKRYASNAYCPWTDSYRTAVARYQHSVLSPNDTKSTRISLRNHFGKLSVSVLTIHRDALAKLRLPSIVNHTINLLTVEFHWDRHRLFDKQCCEALLMMCQADPVATVTGVTLKPKSKYRPVPMDTISLEKLGSRWLKLTAKQTMTIAEKLYSQGFISYPRTETNIFSKDINLVQLVQLQVPHQDWGTFANRVVDWGPNPRAGKKSDQAHPPIHPTKPAAPSFSDEERRVYELVVRHFLACVSRDATASETIVKVVCGEEDFTGSGLCIHERNYLDVYIYEKWNSKEIHGYEEGKFSIASVCVSHGSNGELWSSVYRSKFRTNRIDNGRRHNNGAQYAYRSRTYCINGQTRHRHGCNACRTH